MKVLSVVRSRLSCVLDNLSRLFPEDYGEKGKGDILPMAVPHRVRVRLYIKPVKFTTGQLISLMGR